VFVSVRSANRRFYSKTEQERFATSPVLPVPWCLATWDKGTAGALGHFAVCPV